MLEDLFLIIKTYFEKKFKIKKHLKSTSNTVDKTKNKKPKSNKAVAQLLNLSRSHPLRHRRP